MATSEGTAGVSAGGSKDTNRSHPSGVQPPTTDAVYVNVLEVARKGGNDAGGHGGESRAGGNGEGEEAKEGSVKGEGKVGGGCDEEGWKEAGRRSLRRVKKQSRDAAERKPTQA